MGKPVPVTLRARTRLLSLVAATLLAALLVAVPGSARACACGAAYVPDGHTVQAGDELAFLSWSAPGRERLEMGLSLTSDSAELAVLVPTPAAPEVTQGDPQTFDRLATATMPSSSGGSDRDGVRAAPQQAPSVLSTTVLEDVVATVLQGGTPAGVTRWLARHGYARKPQVTPAIAAYLRGGWVFTAIKLRGDRPFDGYVDPIVLTFASSQLVYPMRLSSTAEEVGTVTIYTLDHSFDTRTDTAGLADAPAEATATITADSYADGPLHVLSAAGSTRLAKFVYRGLEPSSLTADFTFAADPSAGPSTGPGRIVAGSGHGDGGDVPPWAVGLIAFAGALVVGGIGLVIGMRRRGSRWSSGTPWG